LKKMILILATALAIFGIDFCAKKAGKIGGNPFMIALVFGVGAIIIPLIYATITNQEFKMSLNVFIYTFIGAICVGVLYYLLPITYNVVGLAIGMPVTKIIAITLAIIAGIVMFREKLTIRQIVCIVLAMGPIGHVLYTMK